MSDRGWASTINIYISKKPSIVHVSLNVNLDTLMKGFFTQC